MPAEQPGSPQVDPPSQPVTISSQHIQWEAPFQRPPLRQHDMIMVSDGVISDAIAEGILPELTATLRATTQDAVLRQIAKLYIAGRNYGLSRQRSREAAERNVVADRKVQRENVYVYYQRVPHPNDHSPTVWFAEQLEGLWQWYERTVVTHIEPSFRENCRRLRRALLQFRGLPTPALSISDFTVGDFIDAGEKPLLNSPGVDIQCDSEDTTEQSIRLRDRCPIKPDDITTFSVPFANTWREILQVIDDHLVRYSKVDDAIYLTNELDCTEAYAREPDEGAGNHPDVTVSILYYGKGYIDLSATITPRGGTDEDGVRFHTVGTDYSKHAVETFIVQGLREAAQFDSSPDTL